jgi:hypothetical protein
MVKAQLIEHQDGCALNDFVFQGGDRYWPLLSIRLRDIRPARRNAVFRVSTLMWWRSAVNRSFFLCLAACRTRSSAWVTRIRLCARCVLCWPTFPLVPGLGSAGSAAGCPALFVGFVATMPESDFSGSCISGYGSSPSRHGPQPGRSDPKISRFPHHWKAPPYHGAHPLQTSSPARR